MTIIKNTKVQILSKKNIFLNYLFEFDFAKKIFLQCPLTISCATLEAFLNQYLEIDIPESKMNDLFLRETFINEKQNSANITYNCFHFEKIDGILYYFNFNTNTYFNVTTIPYSDIVLASIIFFLKTEKNKTHSIDNQEKWECISEFLLEMSFRKKLLSFLRKFDFLKKEKHNFISGLITVLQNKDIEKKNILKRLLEIF